MQTEVKDSNKYLFTRERKPQDVRDHAAYQVMLIFMTCLKFALCGDGYLMMKCSWRQSGRQVLLAQKQD